MSSLKSLSKSNKISYHILAQLIQTVQLIMINIIQLLVHAPLMSAEIVLSQLLVLHNLHNSNLLNKFLIILV